MTIESALGKSQEKFYLLKNNHTAMRAQLLLAIIFFTSVKIFAVDHFVIQPTGTTNTLRSITFINENTGFSAGSFSTILRTSNGGTNWINVDISSSQTTYNSVAFPNSSTGFVVSEDGELIKTTNGGLNWNISSFSSNALKYVYFFDNTTGFIGGANSALYKTTNAGLNWINVSPGISETIVRIVLYDNEYGFFLTRQYLDSGSVYKTTNGGINWQRVNNFYSGYSGQRALFDCVPLNRDTVYVSLGYYQTGIMRTTNGGADWQRIYNQWMNYTYPGSLYELFVIDRNNIIAMHGPTDGAPCYLIKSTDGGFNFTHPTSKRLVGYAHDGYFFRSSHTAYTCGESGIIVKVFSYITDIKSQTKSVNTSDNFTIAPNPGGNNLKIKINGNTDNTTPKAEIKIYDLSGKEVYSIHTNNFETGINISHLPRSVYMIKVSTGPKENYLKKFVKLY